ncbi:MAG: sugar phosphate isomerase/epimerase [Verrucomicrobia bacterium]|nr:sugar phosphate isomerase/epimerase [Verrucomicrobiota bacterium]
MLANNPSTRRQFLQTTAIAALASSVQAAVHPRRVGLGFSLYGMKTLPVEQALRVCAETGFHDVEFALNPGYLTEPKLLSPAQRKEIRALLSSLGLRLTALMDNLSLLIDEPAHAKNLERIQSAAELAHALAPDAPPLLETVMGGKPADWDKVKSQMAARLADWAKAAAAAKITLCIKPHVSGAAHLPEHALWLLDQVKHPAVKLAYDFSHYQLRGVELGKSLDALLPHTAFIHVKDSVGELGKFQFVLPGEGKIDYTDYFRRLKAANWHGSVCVEVSGQVFGKPGYDPIAAAKKSHAALAPAFKSAGL